jgi:hypothetical protein
MFDVLRSVVLRLRTEPLSYRRCSAEPMRAPNRSESMSIARVAGSDDAEQHRDLRPSVREYRKIIGFSTSCDEISASEVQQVDRVRRPTPRRWHHWPWSQHPPRPGALFRTANLRRPRPAEIDRWDKRASAAVRNCSIRGRADWRRGGRLVFSAKHEHAGCRCGTGGFPVARRIGWSRSGVCDRALAIASLTGSSRYPSSPPALQPTLATMRSAR